MFSRANGIKLIVIVMVGAAAAAAMFWSMIDHGQTSVAPINNLNIDTARQQYRDLYQAAWRQDQAMGNVLMTATLFTPELVELLGRDSGKSEMENQLYRVVKDVPGNQVTVLLTIDSVAGPISDSVIRDSLSLEDDNYKFTFVSWNPLIFPSRIVNTEVPANSQAGVVIFAAEGSIDWNSISNLSLVSRNIDGIPERKFLWAQPGLFSAVE